MFNKISKRFSEAARILPVYIVGTEDPEPYLEHVVKGEIEPPAEPGIVN